jgi:hypothetical protein
VLNVALAVANDSLALGSAGAKPTADATAVACAALSIALHLDDAVAAAGDCGATMAAGSAHSAPPRVQRAAEWWRPLGVDTAEVGRVRDALLLQYEAEHGTAEARGATVPT